MKTYRSEEEQYPLISKAAIDRAATFSGTKLEEYMRKSEPQLAHWLDERVNDDDLRSELFGVLYEIFTVLLDR